MGVTSAFSYLDAIGQEAEDGAQPEQKGEATKQILAEFHLYLHICILWMGEFTQLATHPFRGGGWRSEFVWSVSNKICLRLQPISFRLVFAGNIFTQSYLSAFLFQTIVFA